jgi:hypothetical protein
MIAFVLRERRGRRRLGEDLTPPLLGARDRLLDSGLTRLGLVLRVRGVRTQETHDAHDRHRGEFADTHRAQAPG